MPISFNRDLAIKALMEITIAPKMANPKVSMVRPSDVKPSMENTSVPISVER
jgi:hypothetical protein